MSLRMSFLSAAAGLAVVLAGVGPAGAETAAQDRMKQCGEEWQAAKTAGKVKPGEAWSTFFKECNARLQQGAAAVPPAATAAPPPVGATKTAGEAGKPVAPASAAPVSSAQSRRKQCSDEWQAAKAAGKVKAGESWSQFYSTCNTRLLGEAPAAVPAPAAAAAPAPTRPAAAAPAAKPASTAATDEDTGEGVRNPSPGQLAARERMKECGAEWRSQKEAGKIPAGETWPRYWSACNTRLKAAGR